VLAQSSGCVSLFREEAMLVKEQEINHLKWRTAGEVVHELKRHLTAVIITRANVGIFPMLLQYGVDIPKPIDDKSRYIVRAILESLRESGFSVVTGKDGVTLFSWTKKSNWCIDLIWVEI
jgi:hypothetical protein